MRELRTLAVGALVFVTMAGCANMRGREWSTCAVTGAVIGGTLGGVAGGVATNATQDHPANGERGAAIGGGILGGAALGALLGHAICDPVKTPPPPPVAAAPPPQPAPGTKLATVGSTYFDFDKSRLKPGELSVLNDAVKAMKDNPALKVSVEAHTDSVGSEAYNQKLSERRAAAVRDYLAQHGIDASRISTRGFGKAKPIASNDTAAGRAQNRRAEVIAR
jgi:OOP family OmpA-OmpF porin